MNKVLILLNCCFIVLAIVSCGQQNHQTSNLPSQKNEFPKIMVGVWEVTVNEYTDSKWGIKFEPDGSIKKIIHSLAGPVKLSEGGVYIEGPDPNTYAMFVMGPCQAKYNHQKDELEVKIVLDYFEMSLPIGMAKGRGEDYLRGPISKDGKSWTVNWFSYGWIEGADPPDPNIIEANPEKLTFTKIDIK